MFPSVEDLRSWADRLEEIQDRLAPYFERAEPRQRVMAYLRGLVGQTERKNGWQLAELAGEATPDGMQRLLKTAHWDAARISGILSQVPLNRLGSVQDIANAVAWLASPESSYVTGMTLPVNGGWRFY